MDNKTKKCKNSRQMEKHFKGLGNHHRIDILLLVEQNEGISVDQIGQALNCGFKTASEHSRRLLNAGLINKNYIGRKVGHSLSPYGKLFCKFIKEFQTFQYS